MISLFAFSASAQREMGVGMPRHIPVKINVKNLNTQGTPVDKHNQFR
jgi:hypothetical protein